MRYILTTVFLFIAIGAFGQNPLFTRSTYRVVNSAVNDTFYIEFQGDSVRIRGNHGYLKTNRLVADSIRLNGSWFKGGVNAAGSTGQVQYKSGTGLGANSTFYYNSSDTTVFMKNGKLTGYLYLDKNKGTDTTFLATLTNGRVVSVPLARLPVIKASSGITNSGGTISFGGAATSDMTVTPNSTSVDVSLGTSGSRLGMVSLYANPSSILMGSGIAMSASANRGITADKIMAYTSDMSASMTSDNDIVSKKRVDQLLSTKENSLGNPSVNGQALLSNTDGTRYFSTISANPAGSNAEIQINNSGAFGAYPHFRYTVNDSTLRIANGLASKPIKYTANIAARYDARTLIDKNHADSLMNAALPINTTGRAVIIGRDSLNNKRYWRLDSLNWVRSWLDLTDMPTWLRILDSVDFQNGHTHDYDKLYNKPTIFSGYFNDLLNIPTTVAGYGITDAMTTAHPANIITSPDITTWNTVTGKQSTLVSGTNIKTINGVSVLGSGNLSISPTGLISDSLNFGSDVLSWDRPNRTYKSYTSKPAGLGFYTGTTNPDGTTRLNLNGVQHATGIKAYSSGIISNTGSSVAVTAGVSTSGDALWAYTNTGRASYLQQSGSLSGTLSNPALLIERISGGTGNITGALIEISDVPTTSGTTNYKLLSATIGATERISLNPRATGSTVPYIFDTENTITGFLFTFKKQGITQAACSDVGDFSSNNSLQVSSTGGNSSYMDRGQLYIQRNNVVKTLLYPAITDGINVVPYVFDTENALTSSGTKIASFRNAGTEKANIDKDGIIHAQLPHTALYRNTDLTISAVQNAWHKLTGMTAKDDDFVTYQGDSVRLDYAGSYMINMTISFSGLNNEVWELGVFKNSVLEEPSQIRYTGTSDVGNMSCPVYVYSDGNDWISFKIRNTTDGDDPTIKRASIVISPMHLDL